jgi:mono/diheme cytochrome c family protein
MMQGRNRRSNREGDKMRTLSRKPCSEADWQIKDACSMKIHHQMALVACLSVATALQAAGDPPVDFVKQIKPILADRCVECHNSETLLGDLNLQTRALAFEKRKAGPVIVPKNAEKSMLYLVLTLPAKDKKAMPATGHRIPKDEVSTIRQWIDEDANWPEGKVGVITPQHQKSKKE